MFVFRSHSPGLRKYYCEILLMCTVMRIIIYSGNNNTISYFMFGTKILGCTYLQPHNVHLICTKKCTCLSAVIEIDNEPP